MANDARGILHPLRRGMALDLANFQFAGLRPREHEVSFLAHRAFPPEGGVDWEFLDANHSVERLFRWPPKNQKVPLSKDAMRNP